MSATLLEERALAIAQRERAKTRVAGAGIRPIRLVASMIVHNELGRYLRPCVSSLLEFCDEVLILDDGSDDGAFFSPVIGGQPELLNAWGEDGERVLVRYLPHSFYEHEGRARQRLLEFVLEAEPTHILAIDADEFISDGQALRRALEASPQEPVWGVCMEEVWRAEPEGLQVRCDGGWRPHRIPCLYAVPERRGPDWRIADRALACGREPVPVTKMAHRARDLDVSIFHFGWANPAERQARYDRYAEHDRGRFHANAHLQSILWNDQRVRLEPRPWPAGLTDHKSAILTRTFP